MAPKKNYKRKYTKKNYKRKVASQNIGMASRLSVINSPLATTLKATMLYTDERGLTLVSSATNPGTLVFSLNGMFDPNITGAGHQPRGFDELMSLYDHYVVINTKVRIDCHNNKATHGAYVIATVRDSATESSNYIDYTESTNSQWKVLGLESSGTADKVITLNINPNEFLGRSKPMADPQLKGSFLSNPQEQAFLHVSGMSIDQFTPSTISIMVTLEYTAIFIEPQQPLPS